MAPSSAVAVPQVPHRYVRWLKKLLQSCLSSEVVKQNVAESCRQAEAVDVGVLFSQIRRDSSSDLPLKWMGQNKNLAANMFEMAPESAPSVISIYEIDYFCGQYGEGNESE